MQSSRLMTPEQMVNVWCLMTGASVNATQKEALINLLEECYKAGVRKANTDSPVTAESRIREGDMMCDICGHMFGQHSKNCDNYPGEPCDPAG